MSTVDILTVYLLTVYFSSSPSFESKNRQKKSNSLLFQKSIKFKSPHLVTNLSLNYPINIRDDHHHCSALGLHLIIDYDWMYSETDFRTMKDTIFLLIFCFWKTLKFPINRSLCLFIDKCKEINASHFHFQQKTNFVVNCFMSVIVSSSTWAEQWQP